MTDLPQLLRQWASEDFVFNNPYDFNDRYAGEPDYFTAEAKLYRGRVWETNFIPDIKKLPLYEWKSRGGGGTNAFMVMGAGMMESHVSRFESGHYKKGHRHGPGAHLYITEGEGYVLTQRGNSRASVAIGRKAVSIFRAPGRDFGCTSTSTSVLRRPPTWFEPRPFPEVRGQSLAGKRVYSAAHGRVSGRKAVTRSSMRTRKRISIAFRGRAAQARHHL